MCCTLKSSFPFACFKIADMQTLSNFNSCFIHISILACYFKETYCRLKFLGSHPEKNTPLTKFNNGTTQKLHT